MPQASSSAPDRRSYWNDRYGREPSRYGDEPNRFVREVAGSLPPGSVLDVACGQGRNAVWLAELGHSVTAIDLSDVAIEQARLLAAQKSVAVDFRVVDFLAWDARGEEFDLVVLSYLQLPPPDRVKAHRLAAAAVAPDGRLLLVAHHRENLGAGFGGPDDPDVLYDEEMLAQDFADLIIERNQAVTREVERDDEVAIAIDVLCVARREKRP